MSAAETKVMEEVDSTECEIGYFIHDRRVTGLCLGEIRLDIQGKDVFLSIGSESRTVSTQKFSHFLVCMLGILDPDSLRQYDKAECVDGINGNERSGD